MPAINRPAPANGRRGLVVAAVIVGARLGIEQNRCDHRLHIAPDALPVIGEGRGHALDVHRAGIALHQVLDQELATKGRRWMVENVVEGVADILLWAQAAASVYPLTNCFDPVSCSV